MTLDPQNLSFEILIFYSNASKSLVLSQQDYLNIVIWEHVLQLGSMLDRDTNQ